MPAKRKITLTEDSHLGNIVTDMHIKRKKVKTDRDVEAELFKTTYQQEMIDAFEQRVGIKQKQTKPANVQIKAKLLNLTYAADLALYNKLLNDPKYRIIQMDKSFYEDTYLAFIHYADNLDMKEKEAPKHE